MFLIFHVFRSSFLLDTRTPPIHYLYGAEQQYRTALSCTKKLLLEIIVNLRSNRGGGVVLRAGKHTAPTVSFFFRGWVCWVGVGGWVRCSGA